MARAYSIDLRRRVIEAIDDGLSTRAAARRFAIGISTAGSWYRQWRSTQDLRPGSQGHPSGSKLDRYEAFILGLVDDRKDITLVEIAEQLASTQDVKVDPSTISRFFARRGITYKKRQRMLPSSSEKTSSPDGSAGSTDRSTSIPSV